MHGALVFDVLRPRRRLADAARPRRLRQVGRVGTSSASSRVDAISRRGPRRACSAADAEHEAERRVRAAPVGSCVADSAARANEESDRGSPPPPPSDGGVPGAPAAPPRRRLCGARLDGAGEPRDREPRRAARRERDPPAPRRRDRRAAAAAAPPAAAASAAPARRIGFGDGGGVRSRSSSRVVARCERSSRG